ncbi:hypothetical protein VT84_12420 [Gemmata sp. SH-PL17]|nr:hypothetical protein VT84_12420 [Gemmata sp. SH-PL17]
MEVPDAQIAGTLPLSDLVQDLDFVYSGPSLDKGEADRAIGRVQQWAATTFQGQGRQDWANRVQFHSIRTWRAASTCFSALSPPQAPS